MSDPIRVLKAINRGDSLRRLAIGLLFTVAPLAGGLAFADTFHVTKVLDTRDGVCDSDCSLREAIIAANEHPGPDTVIVPAGTYLLQQVGRGEDEARAGDLDILDDLTIMGAGAESTVIDGNQIDRVFEVHGAAVVVFTGLAIQNGSVPDAYGGGIYGGTAALTLENCTVSGNLAGDLGGGIYNPGGTVTLTNSILSGNAADLGAGIYNAEGSVTVTNTTLSCNNSPNSNADGTGGGIYIFHGTAMLTNSTLSSNSINGFGTGGGIYNAGMLTLENTTLSGNSTGGIGSGGGIFNDYGGTATLRNSTLSDNSAGRGGGIYNEGTATLTNTTLSGNSAGNGGRNYNDATGVATEKTPRGG